MKQYCRYCNNLTTGNGIYCSKRNLCLSEMYAKATNTCSDFEFNPMDAVHGEWKAVAWMPLPEPWKGAEE